jgi:hypothetical protein
MVFSGRNCHLQFYEQAKKLDECMNTPDESFSNPTGQTNPTGPTGHTPSDRFPNPKNNRNQH